MDVAYLRKPVKPEELLGAISLALGAPAKEQEPEPASPIEDALATRPLKILLVEDSLVNQKLAVALLQRHEHTVFVAGNGREALAALASHHFDLILMDVQMPEMDGLEATSAIRAKEKGTRLHVPIVAMTAHAMKGDRERCLQSGMDDYIAKPIRSKELYGTIRTVLERFGKTSKAGREPMSDEKQFDWTDALNSVRGDRTLLKIVVEAALVEVPRLMKAVAQAIAGADAKELVLAAHTLKGATRYFGESPVFQYAQRLERMGKENQFQGADETCTALKSQVQCLLPALREYLRKQAE